MCLLRGCGYAPLKGRLTLIPCSGFEIKRCSALSLFILLLRAWSLRYLLSLIFSWGRAHYFGIYFWCIGCRSRGWNLSVDLIVFWKPIFIFVFLLILILNCSILILDNFVGLLILHFTFILNLSVNMLGLYLLLHIDTWIPIITNIILTLTIWLRAQLLIDFPLVFWKLLPFFMNYPLNVTHISVGISFEDFISQTFREHFVPMALVFCAWTLVVFSCHGLVGFFEKSIFWYWGIELYCMSCSGGGLGQLWLMDGIGHSRVMPLCFRSS